VQRGLFFAPTYSTALKKTQRHSFEAIAFEFVTQLRANSLFPFHFRFISI